MNIAQIEESVQSLLKDYSEDTFIFNLLEVYGKPKSSIARLQNGNYNLLNKQDEILWKKVVYFNSTKSENLHSQIDEARKNKSIISHQPRFLIITDYKTLLAVDTKTDDTLDIAFSELGKNFDFFLPWAGMEKAQHKNENPADVKAAEKMAKLYDEILKDNPVKTTEELHQLNVFLSRLLFCFFAEDTEIFPKASFTHSISSHTQRDGSDLNTYLHKLFEVLNTQDRSKYPEFLKVFPYVNGGLFTEAIYVPQFSLRSRAMIIEAGELDWSGINPDIFGSMFQAVVHVDQRAEMGMHYTSVPNIMKVIEPLFLNDLYEEFDKASDSENKLEALLLRIEKIRVFDPACGSGNFLIIAYKEIRNLEMLILQRINQISKNKTLRFSNISLSNFYGIELDDFAHEVAILSLWLAEHQMNVKFKSIFGSTNPSLPLKAAGNIICGNALRLNWFQICPINNNLEIFVLGNPPYIGGKSQSKEQKEDMGIVFTGGSNFKELDYIACWFVKASEFIKGTNKCRFSFVTTNSICEGAQVEQLWPTISKDNNEIFFAYKPFDWTNNAKDKAGVTCSIIGIQNKRECNKHIYENGIKKAVKRINGYLVDFEDLYITKQTYPISDLPTMITGNSPYDGGHLMLTKNEKQKYLQDYPQLKNLIRVAVGADEFINGLERYCLWISDKDLSLVTEIPEIKKRIENVRIARLAGGDVAKSISNRPHQFRYTHTGTKPIITVPIVSSSRRKYIPIGILPKDTIILSSAAAIYDGDPYVMGVISSRMHMVWVRRIAGKLRSDIRYLTGLCYNTFPFPKISNESKDDINKIVFELISEREKFSELTLAELYDPEKMPLSLLKIHERLDVLIESCYRKSSFESDEERLAFLFSFYQK